MTDSKINKYGWIVTDELKENYLLKCRLFASDDQAFSTFRRDWDYTRILEGGERQVGVENIHRIKEHHSHCINLIQDKLEQFKENDIFGNPQILNFQIFGDICPNTIKYIKNTLDVKLMLGDIVPKKIVEVGGGFGGLCKTMSVLYNFDEYILIDLPDVLELCKKYLNNFPNIKDKIKYITTEEFNNIEEISCDLFISDAALAELDRDFQIEYIDKILLNSKFAYIVWNTMHVDIQRDNYVGFIGDTYGIFDISTKISADNCYFVFLKRKPMAGSV